MFRPPYGLGRRSWSRVVVGRWVVEEGGRWQVVVEGETDDEGGSSGICRLRGDFGRNSAGGGFDQHEAADNVPCIRRNNLPNLRVHRLISTIDKNNVK